MWRCAYVVSRRRPSPGAGGLNTRPMIRRINGRGVMRVKNANSAYAVPMIRTARPDAAHAVDQVQQHRPPPGHLSQPFGHTGGQAGDPSATNCRA